MTRSTTQNVIEGFPTHKDIEIRAYEIYRERGQEEGRADEHWLAAESQLMRQRLEGIGIDAKTAEQLVESDVMPEPRKSRSFTSLLMWQSIVDGQISSTGRSMLSL